MKFDRSKAFPYPVLRPYSDDYLDVEFQALAEFVIDNTEMKVSCNYVVSSDELIEQVEIGNACFVSVISCRETYFREVIKSPVAEVSVSLDPDALRGEVLVDSYIVAIKDIVGFKSPDINAEFGSSSFNFSPGQVLAQEEPHVIYVDRDLYKPISSVFELVRNDALRMAEWRVALDQDQVQIEVSSAMKEAIDTARNNTISKSVLINSLYFSAVVHVLQQIKDGGDYEYKWAKVVERQLHNLNLDLATTDAYIIAQKLMKYPLGILHSYVFVASN
jgi:hypothetical protein